MIKSSAIIVVGALCCTFATEARVIGTTTSDPCVAVCNEFAAIRRGNGEELCDSPELSICVNETSHGGVCSNLYWAVTDDGQRGLTYSTNLDDLTPEERSNPLGCLEATGLVPAAAIHDWTTSTTTRFPWQDDRAESMRLHALAAGWPADWQERVRSGTRGPVSTGNPADWALLVSTTSRPTTPPFGTGEQADAMEQHVIVGSDCNLPSPLAGRPADRQQRAGRDCTLPSPLQPVILRIGQTSPLPFGMDERASGTRGPVSTGNPADWAHLVSTTTTTRRPPSGLRQEANVRGDSSDDYFHMYGTTPEPTHTF